VKKFGIGDFRRDRISNRVGIRRLSDTEEQKWRIIRYRDQMYWSMDDYRIHERVILVKRMKLNTRRGYMMSKGLLVRGQRTSTNSKTTKNVKKV